MNVKLSVWVPLGAGVPLFPLVHPVRHALVAGRLGDRINFLPCLELTRLFLSQPELPHRDPTEQFYL